MPLMKVKFANCYDGSGPHFRVDKYLAQRLPVVRSNGKPDVTRLGPDVDAPRLLYRWPGSWNLSDEDRKQCETVTSVEAPPREIDESATVEDALADCDDWLQKELHLLPPTALEYLRGSVESQWQEYHCSPWVSSGKNANDVFVQYMSLRGDGSVRRRSSRVCIPELTPQIWLYAALADGYDELYWPIKDFQKMRFGEKSDLSASLDREVSKVVNDADEIKWAVREDGKLSPVEPLNVDPQLRQRTVQAISSWLSLPAELARLDYGNLSCFRVHLSDRLGDVKARIEKLANDQIIPDLSESAQALWERIMPGRKHKPPGLSLVLHVDCVAGPLTEQLAHGILDIGDQRAPATHREYWAVGSAEVRNALTHRYLSRLLPSKTFEEIERRGSALKNSLRFVVLAAAEQDARLIDPRCADSIVLEEICQAALRACDMHQLDGTLSTSLPAKWVIEGSLGDPEALLQVAKRSQAVATLEEATLRNTPAQGDAPMAFSAPSQALLTVLDLWGDASQQDMERRLALAEQHLRLAALFEMALRQKKQQAGRAKSNELLWEVVRPTMPVRVTWPFSDSQNPQEPQEFIGAKFVGPAFGSASGLGQGPKRELEARFRHAIDLAVRNDQWPSKLAGERVQALLRATLATRAWADALDGFRLVNYGGGAAFLFAGLLLQAVRNTIVHSANAVPNQLDGSVTVTDLSRSTGLVLTKESLGACTRLTAALLHGLYASYECPG